MSTQQPIIDQCIALAGLSQSIRIVQHVAWKGQTNETDFKAVIASLLRIDAPSAAGVYGGSFEVSSGLRILSHQIDPQHRDKDPEFVNLVINVMALQIQLEKNTKLMNKLSDSIEQMIKIFDEETFYNDDEAWSRLIDKCSDTYKSTLSQLSNRIQVKGEPKFLQQPEVQARVRAALLAAIRATFLWRQSGGSRWHFLFKKRVLLQGIKELINHPIKD